MSKKRLTSYTFDASAQTVVHADFSDITLEGIQLIVNVTDQIIIYNFADSTKGGTLSTDTLTLEYDTTSMDDADKLMILVDDGVASQPISAASLPLPSGATTEAKQDTIIGKLGNIETSTGLLDNIVSGNEAQVDIVAAIPAGDNNIGNVDIVTLPGDVEADIDQIRDQIDLIVPDIEEIRVDAEAIKVAVEILDNAISGNEMQVDVVAALPAGTNAIGKLAANSGVDIGDVDVTSISAGTNLIGDVGIQPRTTNGLDTFMASGSDGSNILVATAQAA